MFEYTYTCIFNYCVDTEMKEDIILDKYLSVIQLLERWLYYGNTLHKDKYKFQVLFYMYHDGTIRPKWITREIEDLELWCSDQYISTITIVSPKDYNFIECSLTDLRALSQQNHQGPLLYICDLA